MDLEQRVANDLAKLGPFAAARALVTAYGKMSEHEQARLTAVKNAARTVVFEVSVTEEAADRSWRLVKDNIIEANEALSPMDCQQIQQVLAQNGGTVPIPLSHWQSKFGYSPLAVAAAMPVLTKAARLAPFFGKRYNRRPDEYGAKKLCDDDIKHAHAAEMHRGISRNRLAKLFGVSQPLMTARLSKYHEEWEATERKKAQADG